jgi:hypothetical protein
MKTKWMAAALVALLLVSGFARPLPDRGTR